MSDDVPEGKKRMVRWIPEMSFGQAVGASATLIGFTFAAMTYAARVDTDHTAILNLQLDMARQFQTVRSDIAALPNVQAEITQLGKRADQADSRADAQSKRLEEFERISIQTSADLNTLIRLVDNTRAKPR